MRAQLALFFAFVLSLLLPSMSYAVEGDTAGLDPSIITNAISGLGMGALIGAAVAGMLGIAALIWGGKKVIGFFTK